MKLTAAHKELIKILAAVAVERFTEEKAKTRAKEIQRCRPKKK